jgi:hypothetical protein
MRFTTYSKHFSSAHFYLCPDGQTIPPNCSTLALPMEMPADIPDDLLQPRCGKLSCEGFHQPGAGAARSLSAAACSR